VRARDAKAIQYERIPSKILQLDKALNGGIPLGKIIEFSGPYSGGKTTVSLKIAKEFQKLGKKVAFVDAEHSFDSEFAALIGVDLDELLISQPADQEEAINLIEMLIKSREINLVILDSVTALIPIRVLEKPAEDATIGIEAKMNNLLMRKVVSAFSPGNLLEEDNKPWCSLIMINQLRANMSMYGVDQPSGGYGIKFFKGIAIEFRKVAHLGIDGEEIKETKKEKWGQSIFFIVKKNKTGAPWGKGIVDFYYKDSNVCEAGKFDEVKDLTTILLENGLIERKGSWYYFGDAKFEGRRSLLDHLKNDKKIINKMRKKAEDLVYGGSVVAGKEKK